MPAILAYGVLMHVLSLGSIVSRMGIKTKSEPLSRSERFSYDTHALRVTSSSSNPQK